MLVFFGARHGWSVGRCSSIPQICIGGTAFNRRPAGSHKGSFDVHSNTDRTRVPVAPLAEFHVSLHHRSGGIMKSTHAVCSAVALLLSACTLYEIHPGVEIVAGRDASDHCGMRDVGLSSDCPATSCLALQKAAPKEAAQRSTPKRQSGARRKRPAQHKEPGSAPRKTRPAGTQPAQPRPAEVQPAGAPQRKLGPARSPRAGAEPDRRGMYREREPQSSSGSPMPPSAWSELQAEAPAQRPRSAPPESPSRRPGPPHSARQAAGAPRGPSGGATAAGMHGAPGR